MTVTHLVSDTTTALPIHHARGLHLNFPCNVAIPFLGAGLLEMGIPFFSPV